MFTFLCFSHLGNATFSGLPLNCVCIILLLINTVKCCYQNSLSCYQCIGTHPGCTLYNMDWIFRYSEWITTTFVFLNKMKFYFKKFQKHSKKSLIWNTPDIKMLLTACTSNFLYACWWNCIYYLLLIMRFQA